MDDHNYRGGGRMKTKAVVLMVMLAVNPAAGMTAPMEAAVEKTPHHIDMGDCLVKSSQEVDQPREVPLLTYVTKSDNATLNFASSQDYDKESDSASFNSMGGTHVVWRDRKVINTTHLHFSRLIPEGWNTFRLTVDEVGKAKVTLVLDRNNITLFTLPRSHTANKTFRAEGQVALCSSVNPAWKVGANESKSIKLHYPWVDSRHQTVEVTGDTEGASPNVTLNCPDSPRGIHVTENTTFMITTRAEGENIHYSLSKGAKNSGGDEVVMNCSVPVNNCMEITVVDRRGGNDTTTNYTLVRVSHTPHSYVQKVLPWLLPWVLPWVVLGVVLEVVLLGVMTYVYWKMGHRALSSRVALCLNKERETGNTDNSEVVYGSGTSKAPPVSRSERINIENGVTSPCLPVSEESQGSEDTTHSFQRVHQPILNDLGTLDQQPTPIPDRLGDRVAYPIKLVSSLASYNHKLISGDSCFQERPPSARPVHHKYDYPCNEGTYSTYFLCI